MERDADVVTSRCERCCRLMTLQDTLDRKSSAFYVLEKLSDGVHASDLKFSLQLALWPMIMHWRAPDSASTTRMLRSIPAENTQRSSGEAATAITESYTSFSGWICTITTCALYRMAFDYLDT